MKRADLCAQGTVIKNMTTLIQMPASYVDVSKDEMEYDGGFSIPSWVDTIIGWFIQNQMAVPNLNATAKFMNLTYPQPRIYCA